MAFTNQSTTSFVDLIGKLEAFMASNGWTCERLDLTTNPTTGGEWAMRRDAASSDLKFAASWDAANTPNLIALYQYVGQNYDTAKRPWAQNNDSGNGFAGKADASIATHRHAIIGSSPVQFWAFEGDHYTHVVVEHATGEVSQFGWGVGEKGNDTWSNGAYCYGQRNSGTTGANQATRDDRSHLLDGFFNDTVDAGGLASGSELLAATVHIEGFPSQTAGGKFCVVMGGTGASPQTTPGSDRQSNDGSSSDTLRGFLTWGLRGGWFAQGFSRIDGSDATGHKGMWPIACTYAQGSDIHGTPLFHMKDAYGLNIKNEPDVLGSEFTFGGETFVVFPAHKKYSGAGAETGTSGYLGVAYRKVL